MRKLHILVEGPTEQAVVRDAIGPYLSSADLYVNSSILITNRPAGGPAYKGGVSNWAGILKDIRPLLGDSSITLLTTLFDYYAFPADAPGMANRPSGSPYKRVKHVEHALAETISSRRFLPHLVIHEIEAWVLAACQRLGDLMGDPSGAEQLSRVVQREASPELVDEGTETAPSKRIKAAYPRFRKTLDGPLVIADAGMDAIRQCCPHADQWLTNIEARLKR
jgi:hypothetical protein